MSKGQNLYVLHTQRISYGLNKTKLLLHRPDKKVETKYDKKKQVEKVNNNKNVAD
jgi:hypothetical protein